MHNTSKSSKKQKTTNGKIVVCVLILTACIVIGLLTYQRGEFQKKLATVSASHE